MADPVTLEQFVGLMVLALGGREGVAALLNKRAAKKNTNGFVTEKFCNERNSHLKETLDDVKLSLHDQGEDIKELLRRTQTQ